MIELKKSVFRVSPARDAGRAVIVGMEPPDILTFRLFRTRKVYTLSIRAAYAAAVRCEVLAKAREKRSARAVKNKIKRGIIHG